MHGYAFVDDHNMLTDCGIEFYASNAQGSYGCVNLGRTKMTDLSINPLFGIFAFYAGIECTGYLIFYFFENILLKDFVCISCAKCLFYLIWIMAVMVPLLVSDRYPMRKRA